MYMTHLDNQAINSMRIGVSGKYEMRPLDEFSVTSYGFDLADGEDQTVCAVLAPINEGNIQCQTFGGAMKWSLSPVIIDGHKVPYQVFTQEEAEKIFGYKFICG
jgi:hypothetical protein